MEGEIREREVKGRYVIGSLATVMKGRYGGINRVKEQYYPANIDT